MMKERCPGKEKTIITTVRQRSEIQNTGQRGGRGIGKGRQGKG